jgi:hypothetical protein
MRPYRFRHGIGQNYSTIPLTYQLQTQAGWQDQWSSQAMRQLAGNLHIDKST